MTLAETTHSLRFRCCNKTQDGNFCCVCGKTRPEESVEGVNELLSWLESKRHSAEALANTYREQYLRIWGKDVEEQDKNNAPLKRSWEGWERNARKMRRFIKTVNQLAGR